MATINDPVAIRNLLNNGGQFQDDPPVLRIYSYEGLGGSTFAIFYRYASDNLEESNYVRNIQLLFDADSGLTDSGMEMIRVD